MGRLINTNIMEHGSRVSHRIRWIPPPKMWFRIRSHRKRRHRHRNPSEPIARETSRFRIFRTRIPSPPTKNRDNFACVDAIVGGGSLA